jgi:hypothetical protein
MQLYNWETVSLQKETRCEPNKRKGYCENGCKLKADVKDSEERKGKNRV